jgi:VWFA-related protein
MSGSPADNQRLMSNAAARVILTLVLLPCAALAQEIRARGEVTVERIIIDAHVIDSRGYPIEDLRPSDFRVLIDGKPAEVEAVEWIPADRGVSPAEIEEQEPGSAPRAGRLLVFFFQTDFQRARVIGQIRMIAHAIEFLETLLPNDRVAVVQFDSHLKVRQDFTADREKLRKAITKSLLINEVPPPERVAVPSLQSRLNFQEAKRAATPEKALFLLGNALNPIPGPKSMIMFGWGFGTYTAFGVHMGRDYALARRALEQARTSVFSLDISNADYHSLEVGLKTVSEDTGGFYVKTHLFPKFAMDKLQRTLSGHYELVVKKQTATRGLHTIDVSLVRRRGEVLTRTTYQDR